MNNKYINANDGKKEVRQERKEDGNDGDTVVKSCIREVDRTGSKGRHTHSPLVSAGSDV